MHCGNPHGSCSTSSQLSFAKSVSSTKEEFLSSWRKFLGSGLLVAWSVETIATGGVRRSCAFIGTRQWLTVCSPALRPRAQLARAALERQHRFDEAICQLREANRLLSGPEQRGYWFALALTHLGFGEKEKSVSCLERACDERDFHLVLLKMDPRFSALCGGERFESIPKKGGLTGT
jgi:tetratricopeptide (TPR) repeat protein